MIFLTCEECSTSPTMLQLIVLLISLFQMKSPARLLASGCPFPCWRCRKHSRPAPMSLPLIVLLISLSQMRSLARLLALGCPFPCQRYRKCLRPALISLLQVLTILLGSISRSSQPTTPVLQAFSFQPTPVYCFTTGLDISRSQFLSLYPSQANLLMISPRPLGLLFYLTLWASLLKR